jgi:hypothetical protein
VWVFQLSTLTQLGFYGTSLTGIVSFFVWHDELVIGQSSGLEIVPISMLR